jgi:hypothetical protein
MKKTNQKKIKIVMNKLKSLNHHLMESTVTSKPSRTQSRLLLDFMAMPASRREQLVTEASTSNVTGKFYHFFSLFLLL